MHLVGLFVRLQVKVIMLNQDTVRATSLLTGRDKYINLVYGTYYTHTRKIFESVKFGSTCSKMFTNSAAVPKQVHQISVSSF